MTEDQDPIETDGIIAIQDHIGIHEIATQIEIGIDTMMIAEDLDETTTEVMVDPEMTVGTIGMATGTLIEPIPEERTVQDV